jgi:hypothetical protein
MISELKIDLTDLETCRPALLEAIKKKARKYECTA